VDFLAAADVIPGEGEAGIAAAQLAADGVKHAVAGAMNGVKLNFIKAFPQFASPQITRQITRVVAAPYGDGQCRTMLRIGNDAAVNITFQAAADRDDAMMSAPR
jgi:hypothetical protein